MEKLKLLAKSNTHAIQTIRRLSPGCKIKHMAVHEEFPLVSLTDRYRVYTVEINVRKTKQ